jgi:hypothetical protein
VLVKFNETMPVGKAVGRVIGMLRDVEASIGIVGVAIDAETEMGNGGSD